jgi:hypothetical protein
MRKTTKAHGYHMYSPYSGKRNWHYKSSSFRGEDCIEEENHLKMAA